MPVQELRKCDTPHPIRDEKGPVREESTANHMAGQARCPGLGPYGRSWGLASSGSQDSEGNSGRMGRLGPAGHQPTRPTSRVRFPQLSLKAVHAKRWGKKCMKILDYMGSLAV
ncbi:hypothetical protein Q8A67_025234 [Cirrhinus molitorella]|uniref:Uncharacterized protein n=1 Tax=Cirrhinus molitorella TaxID=172907 RepID=A0AA88T836_9TELE|nr:hypothetical protein Q8A67_025234 [Cirrhinus molitorella]